MSRSRRNPLGWVQIGLMALSVGISLIAQRLLAKKNDKPISDDKPTTLTTRGSYCNWLLGVREVGPCVAWAGDRIKRKEKVPGGKGLTTPKQDVWYEGAWHVLAVGPVDALLAIKQSGEAIFEGRITPGSHPSGSTVDLGKEGSFTIYWGEQTQPVNSFLGNASRVSVSSRWPRLCYVEWNRKRLGPTPVWSVLNYTIERRPTGNWLTQSQPWYEPSSSLTGPVDVIVDRVASANPDVGYLEVVGDREQEITPGLPVAIDGNALPDGDYEVRRAEAVTVIVGTNGSGNDIFETRTRIYLEAGTAGADVAGTVQSYTFATDDGANIAHVVADMLFEEWPSGLGLDPDGLEPWDLESLEEWGVEAEALGLRSSVISVSGENVASLLGAILQDHGVVLPIDTSSGKLSFRRIREPSGTLPNISEDLFSGGPPEREKLHGEKNADKLTFKFTDRDNGFGDMTVMIREDGSVGYAEYARARDVPIVSTVHFDTAAILAEQRSLEELAGASGFTLPLARGARELIPGDPITADTFDDVLRVLETGVDPLTEETIVRVMADVYGARRSDFVNQPGGGTADPLEPEEDIFRPIEIPEALLTAEQMLLTVVRARAHAQTFEAAEHVSADDVTYELLGAEGGAAFGGFLDVAMAADDAFYQDQGPTFEGFGPDAAGTLDLTGDDVSWSRGRQLALIADDDGIEICFVRKVTALGGGQYRLDGLLRARYDTRRRAWAAEAEVYVFADDEFTQFDDLLLIPDADLYVKSQPFATGGSISLAAVAPKAVTLYGKGLVPVPPESLYVTAPSKGSPSYATGDDVSLRWGWSTSSSKNTGAGYQPAGTAIGDPVIKGAFEVELRTSGGTLVSTQTTMDPFVTFDNAELAASPISEGNFRVRVMHTNNGFTSDFVELLVTKV